jgi:hypothetical protein
MVKRVAIGATSASAFIFSILLAANLLVFASSQGRQVLYSKADAEDSLVDGASALMAAGAANILMEAQRSLSSQVLPCSGSVPVIAALVGSLSDSQRSDGVSASVTAGLSDVGPAEDNLSSVAPFDGAPAGTLGISLGVTMSGRLDAEGVSYIKHEAHFVHLPVELQGLIADCLMAFDEISGTLSSAVVSNCTTDAASQVISGVSRSAAAAVARDGFLLGLVLSVVSGANCSSHLEVTVTERGVEGPGGTFRVQVEEEGSVPFGRPASPQPGGI